MVKFGDYVKELRLKRRITLRQFCIKTEVDPSNWSKIERNKLPPPKSREVLKRIAGVLEVEENSEEWHTLMDLAMIASIPTELVEDKTIVDKLPIFFRTVRGESPSQEELETLIKLIKGS